MVTAQQLCGQPPRQAVRLVGGLLQQSGCPDPQLDARLLAEHVLGCALPLAAAPLTAAQAQQLAGLAARRAAREPLQYLLGSWPFLDFSLAVGAGVLCPRADTETVIEALRTVLPRQSGAGWRILDLCAGTGALGLGAKRFWPDAQVTCVEKSPAAFAYLAQNVAHALPGGQTVTARQGDLFTYHQATPPAEWTAILCNPPYLTAQEMAELQPEVAHEPALALAGGEDGLVFYRFLAEHYQQTLRPGGWLALEIGWQQRGAVTALLVQNGWADVTCRQDLAGNDRCVLARRPEEK